MTKAAHPIGFIAIARPTFDVPLAHEKTALARKNLGTAGFSLLGPQDLVMDSDSIQAAIALFKQQYPPLIVVFQASFADSTMVSHLAQEMDVPLFLWAIPEERTGGRLRLNSFCGINLAGHGLHRAGIHYEYAYAAPDDPSAIAKITAISRAAEVKQRLQQARIGRIGENPAGFDTCLFDPDKLRNLIGLEVVQINLEQVFDSARNADPQAVAEIETQLHQQISGMDKVDAEETRGTLRTYLTLKDMAQEQNLHGIAVRCWPEFFTDLGCSACGAMSMMTDHYTPCSCEADVNGTITQLILQWLSDQPAFGTDMVDFDTESDTAILWHCGLAPLSMADPDSIPEAALHSNRQKPLLMQFPLKPGQITIARLSEASGEMRLVVGRGQMLQAPPAFSGTSGTVRFDSGTQSVMDTILREGLEHHISITYGDHTEALLALARLLGIPVLIL